MEDHGGRRWRCRVVLTASPLQGHMSPMLQLATTLHSKGFSITIAHSKLNPPDPSLHPHFLFLPLPSAAAVPAAAGVFAISQFLQALNNNCRAPFKEYLTKMIDEQKGASENDSVVVIHDNLMFFAGSVADDLNIPAIILRSSSAAFFRVYQAIPLLHQQGRFPVQGN